MEWLKDMKALHPRATAEIEQLHRPLFIVDVVRNLLDDGFTLAQPRPLLEALLRAKDLGLSAEGVADLARAELYPQLIRTHLTPAGELPVLIIDYNLENRLRQMAGRIQQSPQLAMRDPPIAAALSALRTSVEAAAADGTKPMALCQGDVRRALRQLLKVAKIPLPTLSMSEVDQAVVLKTLGTIGGQGNGAAIPPMQPAPPAGALNIATQG
jgi:type III secretion protein V